MAEFVEVARLDEQPPGTGSTFTIQGKDIALFNVDGTIHAMDDRCLHAAASLESGKLEGKVVTCRTYSLRYDVTTGCTVYVPDYGVKTYPTKVEGKSW
ncbi:MAG: Rieske (2Fe-2S) protein [Candidatus Loosdrechtia sp.]|uniref:Rieske (2Fe-2S) protein n=1 Tax=Candidatus Loosdrechtia sp. TaxID=3101272 RepID=UPI003A77C718|nr:MAG: Rieske 2Fe-2S domain-containing protein [Candidatus Jettenia sp. AMX2]